MRFLSPEWHDRLPSTNTVLLERLRTGEAPAPGFVLAARDQTAGRGRYERTWVGSGGQNLTFSFLLVTQQEGAHLASVPMAVALGVADALAEYGIAAQTKWPNDVLIDGGKICGILSERCDRSHPDGTAVVVGVGLNVNMAGVEAAAIGRPATSMRIETGREYAVEAVLDRVLAALAGRVSHWETGGFAALRTDWLARCCFVGDRVSVGEGEDRRAGVLAGFGEAGQLLLRGDDGAVEAIWAGDVAGI